MSARQPSPGAQLGQRALSNGTMPPNSILPYTSPPLERGNIAQSLIDIVVAIFCILFVCVTGVGIAAALFVLLFVRV